MFKILILFLLLPLSAGAEVELSVGYTQFGKQENGYWYQDGFAHTLNMSSPSASIGITDKFYERYRYHVGYKYLGHVSTTAQCMGSDALYASYQRTGRNPLKLGTFTGDGSVNELYFTAGPEFNSGDWHIGLEAGLSVYRPTWTEQGVGFQTAVGATPMNHQWEGHPRIMTGGIIGISAGYGQTDIVLSVQDIDGKDAVWSVYHGLASNLSVRYQF